MFDKYKDNTEKGSVTIEATLTFTLVLFLLIISIGTVFSIMLNERMNQIALQISGEMQVYAMTAYDGEDVIRHEISEGILEALILDKYRRLLSDQSLDKLIDVDQLLTTLDSDLETDGVFSLNLYYRFKMPTLLKTQILSYPIVGLAHSDGVEYESTLVYITNTGEKYHKENCFHLRKSKISIDINKARERGYTSCKNCYKAQMEKE